jgi:hypothetical protein
MLITGWTAAGAAKVAEGWTQAPAELPAELRVRADETVHHEGRQSPAVSAAKTKSVNVFSAVVLTRGYATAGVGMVRRGRRHWC